MTIENYCKMEFEKQFSTNDDFLNVVVNLILESNTNIIKKTNNAKINIIPDEILNPLWIKNKHLYNRFISRMLGKLNKLYDFSDEYSILTNNYVKNIDLLPIIDNLNNNGFHILNEKLSDVKCNNIKEKLGDLLFKPFDSQRQVLGNTFINKNIMIDNSPTFWIANQSDILQIDVVKQLVTDPLILQIVQKYLGCNPILCQTNLWYSGITNYEEERTQLFHQDYDDINFLKIFIYLTDVDINSGPHVYISSSLNNMIEPPNYAPSSRLTDTFATDTYGDAIRVFTGELGTIIIENTNGFHKGLKVTNGNRIVMQLQYSATLLPFQQGCHFFNIEKNDFMKKYPTCFL